MMILYYFVVLLGLVCIGGTVGSPTLDPEDLIDGNAVSGLSTLYPEILEGSDEFGLATDFQEDSTGVDDEVSRFSTHFPENPMGSEDNEVSGFSTHFPENPTGSEDNDVSGFSTHFPENPTGSDDDDDVSGFSTHFPENPTGSDDDDVSGFSTHFPENPTGIDDDDDVSGFSTYFPENSTGSDDNEVFGFSTHFPENSTDADDAEFGLPTLFPDEKELGDIIWATTPATVPITEIDAVHEELEDELIGITCWQHREDPWMHPRCEDMFSNDVFNPWNTTDPRKLRRMAFFKQIDSGVRTRTKAELVQFCYEDRVHYSHGLRAECFNITWHNDLLNGAPPPVYNPKDIYEHEKHPEKHVLLAENYMEFLQELKEARDCYEKQIINRVQLHPVCEGIGWIDPDVDQKDPRLKRLMKLFQKMIKDYGGTSNVNMSNSAFPIEGADFHTAIDCFENRHFFPPPASCKWIMWDPKPKSEPELAAPHRALRKTFFALMDEDWAIASDCYLHRDTDKYFACDGITYSGTHIYDAPRLKSTARERRRRQFYKELIGG